MLVRTADERRLAGSSQVSQDTLDAISGAGRSVPQWLVDAKPDSLALCTLDVTHPTVGTSGCVSTVGGAYLVTDGEHTFDVSLADFGFPAHLCPEVDGGTLVPTTIVTPRSLPPGPAPSAVAVAEALNDAGLGCDTASLETGGVSSAPTTAS